MTLNGNRQFEVREGDVLNDLHAGADRDFGCGAVVEARGDPKVCGRSSDRGVGAAIVLQRLRGRTVRPGRQAADHFRW